MQYQYFNDCQEIVHNVYLKSFYDSKFNSIKYLLETRSENKRFEWKINENLTDFIEPIQRMNEKPLNKQKSTKKYENQELLLYIIFYICFC